MNVLTHNRTAWNTLADDHNQWTVPVTSEAVAKARSGQLEVVLTPMRLVPVDWFPPLTGAQVLGLASAGGQQGPLLSAAGASVTVIDNSPNQLERDREVALRDGLDLKTVQGDMADLKMFSDDSFDMVFHPCSNVFVPDVMPVWRECFRVLRPGGVLLAGFVNCVRFLFDDERTENGKLDVRYPLPYSDLDYLDKPHIKSIVEAGQPLEFGHTLEDQIGGQLSTGLQMTGMYEDRYADSVEDPLSKFMATFIATRSVKPLA